MLKLKSAAKALWGGIKAHPILAIAIVLVVPLVFGGVAVALYRKAKAALPASIGDRLPTK